MKLVILMLCVAALALLAVWFGRSVLGDGAHAEWLLAAGAAAVALARWRTLARRRQRQKLQDLRDSALW